jgi:hypothetical protein
MQGPFFMGEILNRHEVGPTQMLEFTDFAQLDNEAFFIQFVTEQYEDGWSRLCEQSQSSIKTDRELIKLAHQRYVVNLKQYTVALKSQNPDQYKRAGALLHALYETSTTSPIVTIKWDAHISYMSNNDNVGVSYGDAEHWKSFKYYYKEYGELILAFSLAFRCCDLYEGSKLTYNKDYLDNVCYYMKENTAITAASFVMIFKSLWFGVPNG